MPNDTSMRNRLQGALMGLLSLFGATASASGGNSIQGAVYDVMSRYRANEISSTQTRSRLNELSDDVVISGLVTTLNQSDGLNDEAVRDLAYRVLRDKGAARTDVGFQQLLIGLRDPKATVVCAKALLDAPVDKHAQAAENIRRYLESVRRPADLHPGVRSSVEGVLLAIADKGPDALVYVEVIDSMLHDESRNEDVRKAAAWAIVQIKPFSEALKHFENLDTVGVGAGAGAAAGKIIRLVEKGRKQGKASDVIYEENRRDIEVARGLVRKALQSPKLETRKFAYEAMIAAYGAEMIVIRSPDDYEFDPKLRLILADMAANDPDPGLRERAAKMLDPELLKLRVAHIHRAKRRLAKLHDK